MANRTCSIEGCGRPHFGCGYCTLHYQRWYRRGDPLDPGMIRGSGRGCSFENCDRPHSGLGYCSGHLRQFRAGRELKPLRPKWNGAECTAAPDCREPILAQGYCRKHWQRWKKHGDPLIVLPPASVGNRLYALNEAYFDEVDTPEKAYWLGFITADGGIIRSGRTYSLRVELAEADGDHVRMLAQAMGSDKPTWNRRGCVGISLDSRYLTESLARLGITPRKSATVEPWDGPEALMPHFWRGLFDGDGSIYINPEGSWVTNLCGSVACVTAFAEWGRAVCGSKAVIHRHPASEDCWYWAVGGTNKSRLLTRALYGDATVALQRKHELARVLIAG